MRHLRNFKHAGVGLILILLAGAGCGKSSAPPQPVSSDQIPATIQTAFKKASAEARGQADAVVAAMQNNEFAKAVAQLQELCARTDLTPEQRGIASRCLITANLQLQAAAEKGDQKAAEVIQRNRAEK